MKSFTGTWYVKKYYHSAWSRYFWPNLPSQFSLHPCPLPQQSLTESTVMRSKLNAGSPKWQARTRSPCVPFDALRFYFCSDSSELPGNRSWPWYVSKDGANKQPWQRAFCFRDAAGHVTLCSASKPQGKRSSVVWVKIPCTPGNWWFFFGMLYLVTSHPSLPLR